MSNLSQLKGASNGPEASETKRPNMLSVGDSLMWGQGLLPENRFRELVRKRVAAEFPGTPVVELSMARSGAVLVTDNSRDEEIKQTLFSPPIYNQYSADDFVREVPDTYLSTRRQLEAVCKLLKESEYGSPEEIKLILLDGGINDVDVLNILTPMGAYGDGYFLSGWNSWLLDQCKIIENKMEDTLKYAAEHFPNAVIVVNGYFPVFSYFSNASTVKIQGVGVIKVKLGSPLATAALNVILSVGLDALATASAAWQAGSNKHLKKAIKTVNKTQKNKRILFARSNIEDESCLFAPFSKLWEYDLAPSVFPDDASEWAELFAGATPEDEVIPQRTEQCKIFDGGISCRFASIGHPNIWGSRDYADSIFEALENAGYLPTSLNNCNLTQRKGKTACNSFADNWSYQCVKADSAMGKGCASAVKAVGEKALSQFESAGDSLSAAGSNMSDAASCLGSAAGNVATAAANSFERASDNLQDAGDNLSDAVECWDQTALDMQACSDEKAQKIAECNAAYVNSNNTTCNIYCNSYTNCTGRYGKWNPKRYTCLTARGVCVAAAAVARTACKAGILAVREACKAAAEAAALICKGGVVLGNTVCTITETAKAVGNVVLAGANMVLGGVQATVAMADGWLCAVRNTARAVGNVLVSAGKTALGAVLGGAALATQIGCSLARWTVNRVCRFTNWTVNVSCRISVRIVQAGCYLLFPITLMTSLSSSINTAARPLITREDRMKK